MSDSQTLILDYKIFISYYNLKLKYPDCVVEKFNGLPDGQFNRNDFDSKFREDETIPPQHRLTIKDYDNYVMHGGSYGHNATAGFHKSTVEDYLNTYLLSNISPQEGTFNSGLWCLLEAWCQAIIKNYEEVTIITGNIPGHDQQFNDSIINIPHQMYKIILVKIADKIYTTAYIMDNKFTESDTEVKIFKLSEYKTTLDHIISLSEFDLKTVLNFDITDDDCIPGLDTIKSLSNYDLVMDRNKKRLIRSAKLYGQFIYSQSLEELEAVYEANKKAMKEYHTTYYNFAKIRLTQGLLDKSILTTL